MKYISITETKLYMNIVAINRICWKHPKAGGAETNLRETLSRLSNRGHNVTLICSRFPSGPDEEIDDGVKIKRVSKETENRTRLHHFTISAYYLRNRDKYDPDVLYLNGRIMNWFIPEKNKVMIFHEVHGKTLFSQYSSLMSLGGYMIEKFHHFIERKTPKIVVSEDTKEHMLDLFDPKGPIYTVNNGINHDQYNPEMAEYQKPTILYLGRLRERKGVDLLPEIHQELKSKLDCDFEFKVAGEGKGEIRENLESYAEYEDSFEMLGYVSHEKKKELLSKSWATVIPSVKEGWGLVAVESYASKTPVVGSRARGLTSTIQDGETGYLSDRDPEQFASKLKNLIKNDDMRKKFGENGFEFAQSYSWENTADELEDILTVHSRISEE